MKHQKNEKETVNPKILRWNVNKMTKKILKGTVTSAKNNKTIVVEVVRKFKHPFYEKVIKRSKKYNFTHPKAKLLLSTL